MLLLLLVSCRSGAADAEKDIRHADSLSIKLNSPELKAVNAALLKDPANDSLYRKRAVVYLALRQFPEAVNDAKRAVKMDSTNAGNYITLVDIYFAQNNTRLAKELLEITVRKFPENTEALLKLAELFFLVQKYQEGIDYVNKALKIDENIAKAYFIKGSIYRESGDTSKAISSLETAIEQDGRMADAHYDLGVIYTARKNPIAFEYFNNVLRLQPGRTDARYARAKLMQDLGKYDDAMAEYEKMSETDKNCARCFYNTGAILLQIKNNPSKAADQFSKAIEADKEYVEAYLARGYCYALLKDRVSARADYNMCLQLRPNYEPAVQGLNELQ